MRPEPINMAPFAVYGTLRSGGGNDHLWRGDEVDVRPAVVHGFRLVAPNRGWFPYALRSPSDTIVVDLVTIHPARYDDTLRTLDHLEGFRPADPESSLFIRGGVTAHTADESMIAWLYRAGPRSGAERYAPVPGNDWLAFTNAEVTS